MANELPSSVGSENIVLQLHTFKFGRSYQIELGYASQRRCARNLRLPLIILIGRLRKRFAAEVLESGRTRIDSALLEDLRQRHYFDTVAVFGVLFEG